MASRRDIELASLLFRSGILSQEEIQSALGHQGKLLTEGKIVSLPEVLAERGLIPEDSVESFGDTPLQDIQPFPDYQIDEEIGEGASAHVYKGIYKPRELPVAIKVLLPEQELMRKPLKRFMRESHLLCKLRHPNIIRGYEVRKIAGRRFLSMEWFPGSTVLEHIEKRGRLDAPTALHVARQMASALAYLHANRIVHRDIKPGNVLVDDDWTVKMIDLGLCRMLDNPSGDEGDGTTVGTVGYISPEQAKGVADLDVRSDIYSLGVSLYHMVIGEVPFTGDDDFEVMSKQIMQRVGSDELKRLNISPNVHYTIEKMMAKDRDERYQHPDEIVAELDAYLASINYEIIPIARPPDEDERAKKGKSAIVAPKRSKKSSKKIALKKKRGRGDVKPKPPTSRRRRYR
ncbi:MAG: serine/threonine-protein kinase [Planctomycetota bacterium]|jgi:serine/threonine-protein kinase